MKASREMGDASVSAVATPPGELAIRELAHDLRQPVATIAALAEACRVTPGLPSEVQTRLLHILEESARMSAFIRQMLSQRLAPVPVDLGEFAREAAASAQVTSSGVVQAVVQSGAVVVADEVALHRVLGNLVDNAVRAAGEGGSVIITVKRSGGWVRCDVADSGPGFGEGPSGAGSYGLAIVERFLRAHRGRLEIRRSKLGGALLRMRLPAATRPGE